jgi:hypothetical protein
MKRTIQLILILILITAGCSSIKDISTKVYLVKNTKWIYVDEDASYTILFMKNGRLKTTNISDTTPLNDFWEQNGSTVIFNFNNKYSNYEGNFTSPDTIKGLGKNSDYSWSFVMARIK